MGIFGKRTPELEIRQARNTPADRSAVRMLMRETFMYHSRLGQNEPSLTFRPVAEDSYLDECLAALVHDDPGYEPARAFLAWNNPGKNEQAVGFALVRILRDFYYSTEFFGYIEQLIVTETYRSQGVGSKLLDACYDWLKSRGLKTATLKVYGPNQDALRFYEREGYSVLRYELVKHF